VTEDYSPQPIALVVKVLLAEARSLDPLAFESSVQQSLPLSKLISDSSDSLMIAHEDFTHVYADGQQAPMITSVMAAPNAKDTLDCDLSQSWNFPDAEGTLNRVTECQLVAQVVGVFHPYQDRVRALHVDVCAAIEGLKPIAIWCPSSQQLVKPEEAVKHQLALIVNVRLFRIEHSPGEMIMDTLGLHTLGLPDLQCHFFDLVANDMARVLYNTATYLFEEGDVIEDGNTITGIEGSDYWRCRHELAIVAPERIVLDIDVGPGAAGQRKKGPES
jgi:Domain of unknown function (DUF4261)